jgi:hypothetical protein
MGQYTNQALNKMEEDLKVLAKIIVRGDGFSIADGNALQRILNLTAEFIREQRKTAKDE